MELQFYYKYSVEEAVCTPSMMSWDKEILAGVKVS